MTRERERLIISALIEERDQIDTAIAALELYYRLSTTVCGQKQSREPVGGQPHRRRPPKR
jgi:hypothetical protein